MLVIELGSVIEVRPEHPENALCPILVTEFGMVIEVRPTQSKKAEHLMPFVPAFIAIFAFAGIVPLYL